MRVPGLDRVWRALERADYRIARCTVERLMAADAIHGVIRGKRLFTTIADADADADRPADLVERRFVATRPNQLWVTDVTYAKNLGRLPEQRARISMSTDSVVSGGGLSREDHGPGRGPVGLRRRM